MVVAILSPTVLEDGRKIHEVESLESKLENNGDEYITLDTVDLEHSISFSNKDSLRINGEKYTYDNFTGVFFFPPLVFRPFNYRHSNDLKQSPFKFLNRVRELRGAFDSFINILQSNSAKTVCPRSYIYNQEWKLWQMYELERESIPVPDTLVTTEPKEVVRFGNKHDTIVIKPTTYGSTPKVIRGQELTEEKFESVKNAPVQLQEYVSGPDVRAYVVDGEFVGAFKYVSDEDIFENSDERTAERVSYSGNEKEIEKAVDMFDIGYGAVDIRYDGGRKPKVVEVNASGRFALAEQDTDIDVASSIAEYLS